MDRFLANCPLSAIFGHMVKARILEHKFPPNLEGIYDEAFANQLASTSSAIGSLLQIPRLLTNASLLMRPILSKEAESSSQLEGTQASVEDLFKMDIVAQTSDERIEAEEVRNYELAMKYGIDRLKNNHFKNHLIRVLKKILMRE